jgi:primosomal protein N'
LTRPKPELRCGWCHRIITAPAAGHSTRCVHCRRSLAVPSHIRAACDRCGHRQHLRLRELGSQPLCSVCRNPLVVGDVILSPRHHHRSRRHRRPSLSPGYADAAWAVLIVGLALVITLFVMTR